MKKSLMILSIILFSMSLFAKTGITKRIPLQNRPILKTDAYMIIKEVKGLTFINRATGNQQLIMEKATEDLYMEKMHSLRTSVINDTLTIEVIEANLTHIADSRVISIAYKKAVSQLLKETSDKR